jgi:tetratricopeptide (TPR) repeat protein
MANPNLTATDIPQTLRDRLLSGKVIPFVGAGVSMAVRHKDTGDPLFPGWRELLERAAVRLEAEQDSAHAALVRSFLAPKTTDYLQAARYARQGMGAAIWFNFLKEQFDKQPQQASQESLGLARAIWELGSHLIITTNFDRVLHWASSQQGGPISLGIEAPAELVGLLRDGALSPTVWQLHGQIHNAAELILTPEGYSLLYPQARAVDSGESYRAATHTLRSLLTSHSFLFIGFSLDDVYFRHQLDQINDIFQEAGGPHYLLMREADITRGLHDEKSVKIVPYSGFDEPLLTLVRVLGTIAAQKETEVASPTPPPEHGASKTRMPDYGPHHHVFFVPFRQKGDQVIGREAVLQDVRKQLTEGRRTYIGRTAALQGLGGLGKTQLAVEYAYRFKDTYPNGVIWVNADQNIDTQLTELAVKANWIDPEAEHKFKLAVAQQRLRTYSDCLIIFDHLEDLEAIKDYLPDPQANPHILVTSRKDQPDFNPVPLDPLDENVSEELLFQEANRQPTGDEEIKAAREIALALGGLPLALELAGAFLRHRQVSWQQYRDLLNENLRAALLSKLGSFTKYEADFYSTLRINEEILEEEPKLRQILDLLTWSGSAPMGISLMCALLGMQSPVELISALGLGTQLRMLQQISDTGSYAIHRLVSEVRRGDIPLAGRETWVNDICQRIGDWFQALKKQFSDLPRFELELDHLRAWQERAVDYAPSHVSRLILLQAYPPYHRGRYGEAKRYIVKALERFEQNQESDEELKAQLLSNLGVCHGFLGEDKLNLDYAEKALAIRKKLFGENHLSVADSLSNISNIYIRTEDYVRALEYGEKALAIRKKKLGEWNSDVADSLGNLSSIYRELGNYEQAFEYGEKALAIRKKELGEHHPNTAGSLNNLGNIYNKLGNYELALEYSERALAIRLQELGEQHPDTAISLSNIGDIYNNLGDYKQALEYGERALVIQQGLPGAQHPRTAIFLNNLGDYYTDLEDYKQALRYKEKALKLNRQLLGNDHIKTIENTVEIANILSKTRRSIAAFQLLDDLLRHLPKSNAQYSELKKQYDSIKSQCPGFRQSSGSKKRRKVRKH